MSNNWLSALIAIGLFCYNLYSKYQNKNCFRLVIDDMKGNVYSSKKVGFKYKVKFIIYIIISIYSLVYAILANFDDDDEYFEGFFRNLF